MEDAQISLTLEEYYILANTAFSEKDYKNAIKYYSEYIKHVKQDFEAYYNRGSAYLQLKKFDEAIEDFDKAIEINPVVFGTYRDRGLAHLQKKNFEDALTILTGKLPLVTIQPMSFVSGVYCIRFKTNWVKQ